MVALSALLDASQALRCSASTMRSLFLLLIAFVASTQALLLQPAGQLGLHRAATSPAARFDSCTTMSCRTNLKKEKRVRNRINAFRFKKGGFVKRRFNGPDYAAEQKKADEDSQFFSMIFTYSAEADAAAAEEAKNAPKEEAKA